MKKHLLLACALAGAAALANAQPPQPMRPMGPPKAEEMQKILQLDDAQTAKVKKIFEESTQQRQALREKYKPQFEAFRSDMKKLRDETDTKLQAVLTPKQREAFNAMHERGRHHKGQRGNCETRDDGPRPMPAN